MLMMSIPSYPAYFRIPLAESSVDDLKWTESEEGSPGMEADAATETGQTFLFPIDTLFNEGSQLKAYPEVPSDQAARGSTRHIDRATIVHIATRAEGDLSSSSDYEEDSESMMSEASESESGSEEAMDLTSDTGNVVLHQKPPSPTIKQIQLEGDPEAPSTKKTKRGRPKTQIGPKAKGKRKSKDRPTAPAANSVRSIPCFYSNCSYSYKRPGSTIVEISDRPLVLGKKFDGCTIRACKKHHDKWKHKEKRGSCDVCKGLNVSSTHPSVNTYINNNHVTFALCDHCHHKQSATLNLQPGIVSAGPQDVPEPVDGIEGDYEEEGRSSRRGSMDNQSSNSPTLNHAKEPLPAESHPHSFRVFKKEPGSDKYIVYRKTTAPGWNMVKGVTYLTWTIWGDNVAAERPSTPSNRILYADQQPPFQFTIRKIKDDLGLFSDNNIPASTCLGEYTGTVVDGSGPSHRFSASLSGCSTSCPLRVDAQHQGNEFRFLAAIPDREANVYLQQVDEVLLVFAATKINKGDQLILKPQPKQEQEDVEQSMEYEEADTQNSGFEATTSITSLAEKENHYLATFKGIEEYNKENLTPDEMDSSAFYWLIQDGYKILNQKGKITIPIDKRLPSKKSIANNHSIKKTSGILKTDVEWGYVAQLERLDLERAREDCWVTFKASRHWDYDAFLSALKRWKKSQDIGDGSTSHTHIGKAPAHQHSPKKLSPNAVNPSPKKRKVLQEGLFPKEPRTDKNVNGPKFQVNMALPPPPAPVYNIATRQLDEVMYSDLSIKFDGALLGSNGQGYAHVFKGYWKGYPVAVRFPALKIPVGEDQRKQFIEACAISGIVHPNIVTSYGCCKKDQLCLVMELMNLGSLKQWLVKTPAGVQAMYIPRIALDIARGVDYIHSKHMCHGNLKSSNILLKGELLDQGLIANLEVKIGDLGVIPDHLLKKGDSEHFLAPEYFRTKYNSYEADVYSFGKLLCHLFSEGKEEPKSPQEVIGTSQYLQIWDPKWKELIFGCTQIDAAKRPRFSEIVDSLVSLLDSSKL